MLTTDIASMRTFRLAAWLFAAGQRQRAQSVLERATEPIVSRAILSWDRLARDFE